MDKVDLEMNSIYKEDVESVLKTDCNFKEFKNKTFLITGASGLIGSILVDMLVFISEKFSLETKLFLVSRNCKNHIEETKSATLKFISCNISKNICAEILCEEKIDFVIHLASNVHPKQYAAFPIETIETNVLGTKNLLEITVKNSDCRFLLASSVEIYGDGTGFENGFSENQMGFLDCNTSRACYNESKRLAETLCQAYKSEKNADVVIARFCRCYGPTLKKDDSKALSQFLLDAIAGKNIVLKSEGNQYFSYLYSADAASALIFLLLNGKNGEAYNVADEKSNIHLNELAKLVADFSRTEVLFELPSESEKKGYSKAVNAILNVQKINVLGWQAQFGIEKGIRHTIEIMKEKK